MHQSVTRVLFVSRDNACRSRLAEACLNHLGKGKIKAFSCGMPSDIADKPHNWTLLALQTAGIPGAMLRPQAWTAFTRSAAPKMDCVIGLDAATHESNPAWAKSARGRSRADLQHDLRDLTHV